ncbi:MAG: hypothetical protein ACO1SX_04000 [Actinomycetota bacterium]
MPSRSVKLVAVPATVTVLCGLGLQTPKSLTKRFQPPPPVAKVVAPKPEPVKELPRLIAVNKRIARRVNALRPCVKTRLSRVVAKLPKNVTLMVTSAARTRQEQAALTSTFGVKAAPGTSTHEDGRGVDLNVLVDGERIRPRVQHKVIGQAMASEGFRYLGAMDPVHYSVPKAEIDTTLLRGPEMTPPTVHDLNEIKAEVAQQQLAQQKLAAGVDLSLQQP